MFELTFKVKSPINLNGILFDLSLNQEITVDFYLISNENFLLEKKISTSKEFS